LSDFCKLKKARVCSRRDGSNPFAEDGDIMSIAEDLKHLGSRNPRGAGAKPAKTVAIDTDMANVARAIAEIHRVTINSVVSLQFFV
jgi:hypothetical protein